MNLVRKTGKSAGAVSVSKMQAPGQPAEYAVQAVKPSHEYVCPYVMSAVLHKGRYFHFETGSNSTDSYIVICDFTFRKAERVGREQHRTICFDKEINLMGIYYPPVSLSSYVVFKVLDDCRQLSLLQMKYNSVWVYLADSKNLTVMSCRPDFKRLTNELSRRFIL